jgi:U-box domain
MDSESLLEFQIQLLNTFDNYDFSNFDPGNEIIHKLISICNETDLPDDIKSECINNTFATFMTQEQYIKHFWLEVEQTICIKKSDSLSDTHCFDSHTSSPDEKNEKNENKTDEFYNFIDAWAEHANNVLSAPEKHKLLQNLINGIPKISSKVCRFTGYLWSFKGFRKMIQCIDLNSYKTGIQIQHHGIFSQFFTFTIDNLKYPEIDESHHHLINDVEMHEYIIKYIHKIFQLNEAYTMGSYFGGLLQVNCSSGKFLMFVVDFLFAICKRHNKKKQNISNEIITQNNVYKIKNYDVSDTPLNVQLFVTLLHGMFVTLEYCYKGYNTANTEKKNTICKFIKKKWIQDVFIEYYAVHKYLGIEFVFVDILKFFEFGNKKISDIKFNDQIYAIISNILGGMNGGITNPYTRMTAFNIIEQAIPKVGFDPFDNFFNNMLKYINEVNIKKLEQPEEIQIRHQYSITSLLLQMIDIHHKINEESKYIFAETLYKLMNNSYDLLQLFSNEMYAEIITGPNAAKELINYNKYYKIVLNTLIHTILIYKLMYDNAMVETVYPETEDTYIMLIGRILQNLKMEDNNIFKLKLHHKLDYELVGKCLDIIYEKIDAEIDIVFGIKNSIELALKEYRTDTEKYSILLDKLNQYEKTNGSLEYPDDLVDQITCQPIKRPFMIPNCDLILDRTSIMKQIYDREENPFTKEKLTLKMIEEYNKETHVVDQINQFNEKREKWMSENISK